MTDKLTRIESGPAVAANEGGDIESLLRFAVEKGASVETIERMMAVRRELRAERAKEAFDAALAAFQAACPIIEKRKSVFNKNSTTVRYKFAPLDDIVVQVKDLLKAHGFSYSLDTEVKQGTVKAICKITHEGGHFQVSGFEVPVDKDAFMNSQQQFASALTFAKRYAFCNSFGILTGDQDTDSITKKDKPPGPSSVAAPDLSLKELARELWELLAPIRGSEKKWDLANEWLWREEILDGAVPEAAPHLSAARFREVITQAKAKLTSQP